MEIDQETRDRISHLRLMAFGSWLLVMVLFGLSFLARYYDRPLLGYVLLGAAVLFGLFFIFHVVAMMAAAVSLIHKRRSSDTDT
ncbi:hypothetical protein L3D22_04520 [Lysobacter soli]|uniref:hypothetical protein n=1 Tax=Lysobacter soli TaxID=453783 RepID=UPI0020A1756C|nr:hypothetical protein [Lysobacter soli]MDG2519348.1 hypothetical protein [Lysobacter soli]UTA55106.1 hypothetical protein L3D22_04520 [Lysobacter soli]